MFITILLALLAGLGAHLAPADVSGGPVTLVPQSQPGQAPARVGVRRPADVSGGPVTGPHQ